MKKIILALLMTVACFSFSYAKEGANYATTGVWEIGGNVEFAVVRPFTNDSSFSDYTTLYFGFAPQINYFIINGFHAGFIPYIFISSIFEDNEDPYTTVHLIPSMSLGYCFRLSDRLFFDVAGEYGFGATIYDNDYYNDRKNLMMKFGLALTFKIPVGNALINIGIKQEYRYESWDDPGSADHYQAGLILGFSLYL